MQKPNLKNPVHFVGIGGAGMAPLAELCHLSGITTSGSDLSPNKATNRLQGMGVRIFDCQVPGNLPSHGTIIYSSAITEANPEMLAARERSEAYSVMHRSDLLADLVNKHQGIAIAGTHGKTTTSAMIAFMLKELGLDPSAAIGGRLLNTDSSALLGEGDYFVAEADESDGSLISYKPLVAVLTNIAEDHLEVHKSIDGLKRLFNSYLNNIDNDGVAIIGWDNPHCRDVGHVYEGDRLTYGFVLGSDVRAFSTAIDKGGASFKAVVERDQVSCRLRLLGRHNVQNALAALAVARALELDVKMAAESLAEFKGVARRTSIVYEDTNIAILDDYAHNPGKIAACIESVADAYPDRTILVVFQPHRFSRLQTVFSELSASFSRADLVVVVPTFGAGEEVLDKFSARRVSDAIGSGSQVTTTAADNFDLAASAIIKFIEKPAIIITVGAGDVWQCGPIIRDRINGKEKSP